MSSPEQIEWLDEKQNKLNYHTLIKRSLFC